VAHPGEPTSEGDPSDLAGPGSARADALDPVETATEHADPASPPSGSQRPVHVRARIDGVEAGVAAGLAPPPPSEWDDGERLGVSGTPADSYALESDDRDQIAVAAAARRQSSGEPSSFMPPALPDWRDPPTREVPRVLLDHPLADPGPAYPGPVWREVESDWDHDDLTFAEIVREGASVADHGLSLDEPDPFAFDFAIERAPADPRSGVAESASAIEIGSEAVDGNSEHAEPSGDNADAAAVTTSSPYPEATTGEPAAGRPARETGRAVHRARVSFAGRVRRDESGASPEDPPKAARGRTPTWMRAAKGGAKAARPVASVPAHLPAVPRAQTKRRNPVVATVTGLAFGCLALLCFLAGPPFVLGLVIVVLLVSMAECFQALRRARYQPAVLLGLLAVPVLAVGAYEKGPQAFPIVIAAYVFLTMCWYLFGITRRSPVANIGASVAAFVWVGVLGGFALLLLDPRAFPDRHGLAYLLGAIEATVAYDVGGYAFGSWAGDHKLAPRISPNKTWEGLLGGCFAAICISVTVPSHMAPWAFPHTLELGIVVAVFAPLGDLVESMIKRDLGVKDMGTLLPAHGGLLDRVDSLLFVLPATYILVRLFHG
jgi:CDP-diglyceride synthetase